MTHTIRSKAEAEFRKSTRCLMVLFVLVLPITLLASKLSHVFRSDLVFDETEAAFMTAFLFTCVWSYIAYRRWTGQ